MDLQLKGHRAIVTGSSAGIGEAIARKLAAEGAAVIVHGRRAHAVHAVARAISADGGHAEGLTADLADPADCAWLVSRAPAGGDVARPASGPDEAAGSVLPYRLGMPARKRPTPQDAATARRILLDGMARDTGVSELAGELAPLHPRDNTFPGEVLLQVAADALEWCEASRADPLALEGMPERFLPECAFRGRQSKKLQFAVLAAAALRGGAEPDLLDEIAWWQTDDFWQYALYAAVAYIRAAASRAGVPVRRVCQELAQRAGPQPG